MNPALAIPAPGVARSENAKRSQLHLPSPRSVLMSPKRGSVLASPCQAVASSRRAGCGSHQGRTAPQSAAPPARARRARESKTGEHDPPFRGQCPPETRALPHAAETAQPPVGEPPEPKHSSWRVWTPLTLTSTVFGLRALTLKARRVLPSPTSSMPTSKSGGDFAASPIVAWNRRALCFSLYAGKAVGSPTLQ
jgi:hypothetical protein